MINIQVFTFNAFQENTYLLWDESGEGVIIDPGCYEKQEKEELKAFVAKKGIQIKWLLNTHCHVDHVLGNQFVKDTYGVPLLLHAKEEETLRAVQLDAPMYGFTAYAPATPDGFIDETAPVCFGNSSLQVLFVPGHSVGHVAFYSAADKFCINGDVLFNGSIGRTDLPGGDLNTLLKSIREKMFQLPDDTTVYCGHGPETSIGYEKKYNPFAGVNARYKEA